MDDNVLQQFDEKIDACYNSRLILVDKPISELLKTLVSRQDYFSVLRDAAKTASFSNEFQKSCIMTSEGKKFLLPTSDTKIVSLVTGLLFEFDKGNLSIVDFVTSFFPSAHPHGSYIQFCKNVLLPFSDSFSRLMKGEPPHADVNLTLDTNTRSPLVDKVKEDCDYWIRIMIDSVIGDNSINERLRQDALKMLNGFLHILDLNDPIITSITWTGLNYTLSDVNAVYRELRELELLLKKYGAIDK
ncbi:MAG TPA: hypothetical protein PKX91_02855 [Clostridia bacterium]|jgi:hypothetical protein|nr:hypothetical protein [Clostridia bacterium]